MAICDDAAISILLFHEQLGEQNHVHTLFLYKVKLSCKIKNKELDFYKLTFILMRC